LHRYIQIEIDFMGITSLSVAYRLFSRSIINLRRRSEILDLKSPHGKRNVKVAPTHKIRDKTKMATLRTTSPSCNLRRVTRTRRRTWESVVNATKSLGTTLNIVSPSNHWWSS
jgi:hypothetical protein